MKTRIANSKSFVNASELMAYLSKAIKSTNKLYTAKTGWIESDFNVDKNNLFKAANDIQARKAISQRIMVRDTGFEITEERINGFMQNVSESHYQLFDIFRTKKGYLKIQAV